MSTTPAWAMTLQQFQSRTPGVMVEGLSGITVAKSPPHEAAYQKNQEMIERLSQAKIAWLMGKPDEARYLPKTKQKLYGQYTKARDKYYQEMAKDRDRMQMVIHGFAIERALREGKPVPDFNRPNYQRRDETAVYSGAFTLFRPDNHPLSDVHVCPVCGKFTVNLPAHPGDHFDCESCEHSWPLSPEQLAKMKGDNPHG